LLQTGAAVHRLMRGLGSCCPAHHTLLLPGARAIASIAACGSSYNYTRPM